jgi:predicted nucleic acid-binding protein
MTETCALLDTSVLIDLERIDLGVHVDSVLVTSSVCVGELASGIGIGPDPEVREARLRRVIDRYEILSYGIEEAKLYGVLCTLVRAAGRNPRPRRLDLQIAATAASARLPLLTCNPDDFVGVHQLVEVLEVDRVTR